MLTRLYDATIERHPDNKLLQDASLELQKIVFNIKRKEHEAGEAIELDQREAFVDDLDMKSYSSHCIHKHWTWSNTLFYDH